MGSVAAFKSCLITIQIERWNKIGTILAENSNECYCSVGWEKETAIANSTVSFFLPVSSIDSKLLLVLSALLGVRNSVLTLVALIEGQKEPLNIGTVLWCSSWQFISAWEHVMSALCSVSVLQHFFLPDFPSRGAEKPAEGDAVERRRFIGKASSQSHKALSI